MERYWPSYPEEYQVTEGTVNKNGSWAKIEKEITYATLVELTKIVSVVLDRLSPPIDYCQASARRIESAHLAAEVRVGTPSLA
jgi:hypothetical protein